MRMWTAGQATLDRGALEATCGPMATRGGETLDRGIPAVTWVLKHRAEEETLGSGTQDHGTLEDPSTPKTLRWDSHGGNIPILETVRVLCNRTTDNQAMTGSAINLGMGKVMTDREDLMTAQVTGPV